MEVTTESSVNLDVWNFPNWRSSTRKLSHDNPFFVEGNIQRELIASHIAEELTADEIAAVLSECQWDLHLHCPVAGCQASLSNVREFDAHYASRHMATCATCSKFFPTTRLLNFHVAENHDSFFKVKVARNYAMYECLVEGCGIKFQSDSIRKHHLVKEHHFPKSFHFSKDNHHLSQKARAKQHQRRKGSDGPQSDQLLNQLDQLSPGAMGVDSLAAGLSRLSTGPVNMPHSIAFGRRRGRGVLGTKGRNQKEHAPDQDGMYARAAMYDKDVHMDAVASGE